MNEWCAAEAETGKVKVDKGQETRRDELTEWSQVKAGEERKVNMRQPVVDIVTGIAIDAIMRSQSQSVESETANKQAGREHWLATASCRCSSPSRKRGRRHVMK